MTNTATSNVLERAVQNAASSIWDCFTIDVTDNTIVTCNKCGNKLYRETGNKSLHNHMRIHSQKDDDAAGKQVLDTSSQREEGIMVPLTQPVWEDPVHQPVLKQESDQEQEQVGDELTLENSNDKPLLDNAEDQ